METTPSAHATVYSGPYAYACARSNISVQLCVCATVCVCAPHFISVCNRVPINVRVFFFCVQCNLKARANAPRFFFYMHIVCIMSIHQIERRLHCVFCAYARVCVCELLLVHPWIDRLSPKAIAEPCTTALDVASIFNDRTTAQHTKIATRRWEGDRPLIWTGVSVCMRFFFVGCCPIELTHSRDSDISSVFALLTLAATRNRLDWDLSWVVLCCCPNIFTAQLFGWPNRSGLRVCVCVCVLGALSAC